jgi:hypothetical protein
MAPQIDLDELRAAWRALHHESAGAGWRTIPILGGRVCPILAGREFPGNEEAILVGFQGIQRPPAESLPQGQGFLVTCPELGAAGRDRTWIGLARQPGGDLDLFAIMAADVLGTLESRYVSDDLRRFSVFVARIRSWQEFMRRGMPRLLSPEAELGLVGELQILSTILQAGYPAALTVEAWKGPQRGLHDFALDGGAIEVKSAIASRGFPAHITSLDQLDESLVRPLYLAAVRLDVAPIGKTLSQYVDSLRELLALHEDARADFDSRLIEAGFMDSMRGSYVRAFHVASEHYYEVGDGFPRLTRASVPRGVTKAIYELDLDLVSQVPKSGEEVLRQLGVLI